jgi:hypothetical protein
MQSMCARACAHIYAHRRILAEARALICEIWAAHEESLVRCKEHPVLTTANYKLDNGRLKVAANIGR